MSLPVCDVPIEHIVAVWPHVRDHIAKVLRREGSGRYETSDILAILLNGKAKLWMAWNSATKTADAAIVTEILRYPRLTECRIWLVGGHPGALKQWVFPARDMIEAYARAQGCAYVTGAMRRGWIRIGGEGWHESGCLFEKRL